MKKLHWTILRSLPGPFLAALGTLMFLLLLQFLITYMKDLVGRDLPLGVIIELVSYSLAYMVSLAVPMSLLIATLLVFGRIAEEQTYAVAKSAGISLLRLTWPVMLVGLIMFGGMSYFNAVMLPEANHRMRALWQDIRVSRPGFELEPGVFFDGLDGYAIRVDDMDSDGNVMRGVVIFDSAGSGDGTIVAREGQLSSRDAFTLEMTLRDGEIHRLVQVREDRGRVPRYERIAFSQHRLSFDVSDLIFERTGTEGASRTGRTMRADQLRTAFDSIDASAMMRLDDLARRVQQLIKEKPSDTPLRVVEIEEDDDPIAIQSEMLASLPASDQHVILTTALQRARAVRAEVETTTSTIRWESLRADRFRVEYYKKYSMALACVVFIIVGIPLGLMVRRRGYGWALVAAVGVFLFYWITLVQGEKLADRAVITPWVGIWTANIVGGIFAILFFLRESRLPAGLPGLSRKRKS